MPRHLIPFAALAAAGLFMAAAPAVAAGGAEPSVSIRDSGFVPARVTVKQWHVVTWTNTGRTAHTVTSDAAKTMASGELSPGAAFATLFESAGTFRYHDALHPQLRGTVVVVPAPKPAVTGPKPPTGTLPPGFTPKQTVIGSVSPSHSGGSGGGVGGTWIAIAAGALAALAAAGVTVLARRRRG